jgi:hypothetical protein
MPGEHASGLGQSSSRRARSKNSREGVSTVQARRILCSVAQQVVSEVRCACPAPRLRDFWWRELLLEPSSCLLLLVAVALLLAFGLHTTGRHRATFLAEAIVVLFFTLHGALVRAGVKRCEAVELIERLDATWQAFSHSADQSESLLNGTCCCCCCARAYASCALMQSVRVLVAARRTGVQ